LPKDRRWSPAEIGRLKQEHADTLTPARNAAADIVTLERRLSGLVNAAYGLTPEAVALIWRTAPLRMPLDPADELLGKGGDPAVALAGRAEGGRLRCRAANLCAVEGWPSGLRRTLGKRVYVKAYRGFESHSLRSARPGS
jgi:hypothetical protein